MAVVSHCKQGTDLSCVSHRTKKKLFEQSVSQRRKGTGQLQGPRPKESIYLCTLSWEAGSNVIGLLPVIPCSCLHSRYHNSFSMHLMVQLASDFYPWINQLWPGKLVIETHHCCISNTIYEIKKEMWAGQLPKLGTPTRILWINVVKD